MTQTDYIAKIRQNEAQPPPPEVPLAPHPVARAKTRRARLELALSLTDRAGISRMSTYPPMFRMLAGIGLILKPLHYRSFAGLTFFNFVIITLLFAGAIAVSLWLGVIPRALAAMLKTGPIGVFTINTVLALGVATVIRGQARRAGLPRWRDL